MNYSKEEQERIMKMSPEEWQEFKNASDQFEQDSEEYANEQEKNIIDTEESKIDNLIKGQSAGIFESLDNLNKDKKAILDEIEEIKTPQRTENNQSNVNETVS